MTAFETLPHVVADLGRDAVLALAASSDGRAHLRGLVERARPAMASVGRGPRDAERAARDGLGRAPPRRRRPRLRGRARRDARRRSRASAPPIRSTSTATCCSRRAAPRGSSTTGTAATATTTGRSAGSSLRPDAIPETDTVPVVGERQAHAAAAALLGHDAALPRPLLARARAAAARARGRADHERPGPAGPPRRPRRAAARARSPTSCSSISTRSATAAPFLEPEAPAGIEWVFVNGEPVVSDGVYDPAPLPGRALRARTP